MSLRLMLLKGLYGEAVQKYGEEDVRDEIEVLINDSLASIALSASDYLGYKDLAKLAAKVVSVSGLYSKEARLLAEKYPWK